MDATAPRTLAALAVVVALGCGPRIEDDPVPEHRIEPCETWCEMVLNPQCPLDAEVETEEECVEVCTHQDIIWVPISEDEDACTETYLPYIDCMASLSCEEVHRHFELMNEVPDEERSSCGELLVAQLECQRGSDR